MSWHTALHTVNQLNMLSLHEYKILELHFEILLIDVHLCTNIDIFFVAVWNISSEGVSTRYVK